jgi:hypothetical protein
VIGRKQALWAAFDLGTCRIDGVIIGRQHGVLAGTDRMMSRAVAAATAQVGQDAVVFAMVPIVGVGAAKRPLSAAHPREE